MISRDWKAELEGRVAWIRGLVEGSGVKGIIFGNSGGKDSALVGILCKAACENTVGVIMPCASRRNYGEDADDGRALAKQYGIETCVVDLTGVREAELAALRGITEVTDLAAPAYDDALYHCRGGRPPGGRNREPQRSIYGILYQMGRRRL